MVVEWYRDQGYNFLALSEHNVLAQGEKWRSAWSARKRPEMKAQFEKYLDAFRAELGRDARARAKAAGRWRFG